MTRRAQQETRTRNWWDVQRVVRPQIQNASEHHTLNSCGCVDSCDCSSQWITSNNPFLWLVAARSSSRIRGYCHGNRLTCQFPLKKTQASRVQCSDPLAVSVSPLQSLLFDLKMSSQFPRAQGDIFKMSCFVLQTLNKKVFSHRRLRKPPNSNI